MWVALLRKARPAEAVDEFVSIRWISEWQSTKMIGVRVSWIDFLELAPNLAGFFHLTQMPQRAREEGARQISIRCQRDALLEHRHRGFVIPIHEIGRTKEVPELCLGWV